MIGIKFRLCIIFCMLSSNVLAQDNIEDYSYVSNNIVSQTIGLPTVREIGGGTKIVVDYQGDWSEDMKGAFEYACKIWEETIPTTFPIRVLAVLDQNRNTTALSKVSTMTNIHADTVFDDPSITKMSTWLQIKGTTMSEMLGKYETETYRDILTPNMLNEHDITITYYNKNSKLKENCCFALNENIDVSKYDFITLVLRDLAKGMGIIWSYNNPNLWPYIINENKITPFENKVLSEIGYYNLNSTQNTMYTNATRGSICISGGNFSWELYAPQIWDANNSLSTFIPNDNQKLTKLMSYNIGRGSVVRDISDLSTTMFFKDILNWKGSYTVGLSGSILMEDIRTNSDVVAYNGVIPLSQSQSTSHMAVPISSLDINTREPWQNVGDSLLSIINRYHPIYGCGDMSHDQCVISILLNDGSWDYVYTFESNIHEAVSVSELNFHHQNKDYARTTDGYLKCRISRFKYNSTYRRDILETKYLALAYLPQVCVMAKSKVLDTMDDYYADVEIGFKNIEGTTRIVVSQFDYGEDVPYQYVITDVKSGKFLATVDKEFPTTFIITSYNENGTTQSETYTLEALQPISNVGLSCSTQNGIIHITPNSKRLAEKKIIDRYCITPVITEEKQELVSSKYCIANSNKIDIRNLKKGLYSLSLIDIFDKKHSFKFIVK